MPSHAISTFRRLIASSRRQERRRACSTIFPEGLEHRVVPTILFTPQYGAETASYGGGAEIFDAVVHPIFWGSYWNPPFPGAPSPDSPIMTDLQTLISSSYYSGIAQYVGQAPKITLAPAVVDTTSTAPPTGSVPDATLSSDVVDELQNAIDNNVVSLSGETYPLFYGTPIPIYLVITPPTTIDVDPKGMVNGWNTAVWMHEPAPNSTDWALAPMVWLNGVDDVAQTTESLGHELAECMTDAPDPSGTTVTQGASYASAPDNDGPSNDQIADHEARNWGYRLGGPAGLLVQSYWSKQNDAYIVPDGNSFQFLVSGGTAQQFQEPTGSTLIINGGQAGASTADMITVAEAANGEVTAELDGQTVWFDPGVISNVIVNATSVSTVVNLTGEWSVQAKTNVTINDTSSKPVTINLCPDSDFVGDLAGSLVTVNDPNHDTSLNILDSADGGSMTWSLNGTSFVLGSQTLGSQTVVWYATGSPGEVTLDTGQANDVVYVNAVPSITNINLGGSGNAVDVGWTTQDLNIIQAPLYISGTGPYNAITFNDRGDTTSQAVTFESGTFWESNTSFVAYSDINQVDYLGGPGNDAFSVVPLFENLDDLTANILIFNGSGSNSLTVNDAEHAASSTETSSQYEVTGGAVSRTWNTQVGSTVESLSRTINYLGMTGGVTLDTDNLGTPVDIEGPAAGPITVNVGSGNTTVTVAAQGQSLAGFGSYLMLNGGTGTDTLVVNDQRDPYASAAAYMVESSFIYRSLPVSPYAVDIGYQDFIGGVTLDTDNNGTPVDIEGISDPTTVNLGTGNTAVSVTALEEDLGYVENALAVNGGGGTDSLTVNDSLNPQTSSTSGSGISQISTSCSYTVTGQSISRSTLLRTHYFQSRSSISISYADMSGGVTLDTDNNGTPIDIEGTSAPTTVNLGTGSTAVSVGASAENLELLTSNLTVNGGGGTDSLTVNDSLNPLASHTSGSGMYASSTNYGYTVTGQSISRTTLASSHYFHLWSAILVSYSNMSGGVTLDTDNHGTPVDIEGTPAPTTVNLGTGNTAVSVTASAGNLGQLEGALTVNGGGGTDSLNVNDSLNPLASGTSGTGMFAGSTNYSYTVTGQSISRTTLVSTHYLHMWSTILVSYSNMSGSVTLDTDNNGTPVYVSGSTGPDVVTINGGTGNNSLTGPAVATSWGLTGANSGSLGGWVNFNGFANLDGGSAANSFDFYAAGSLSGSIAGGTGPNLLNYAYESSAVTVNLATDVATQVAGGVTNIQGVVGSSGTSTLTGPSSGHTLLIGGAGAARLTGGSSDTLLIGSATIYDLNDAALEAVVAEWDRTDIGFSQRITDLTSGGGLNASYVLTASTVTGTSPADTLTSSAGQTWFIAQSNDTVVNKKTGDVVTMVP